MRRNNVREKVRGGGVVYGIMAAEFFTPGFCQIASNAGAEFIIFDMEHGAVGIDLLKAQMAFARGVGVAPLVRVPGVAYHLIAPVLDAGAMGIMAPMVETREQAKISPNGAAIGRKEYGASASDSVMMTIAAPILSTRCGKRTIARW